MVVVVEAPEHLTMGDLETSPEQRILAPLKTRLLMYVGTEGRNHHMNQSEPGEQPQTRRDWLVGGRHHQDRKANVEKAWRGVEWQEDQAKPTVVA